MVQGCLYTHLDVYKRQNLAKELTEKPGETLNEELSEEDGLATIKKKVIKHNVTAINDLEQTLSEDTIAEFLEFLAASKRVLFFGVGASASISQDALHKFGNIGINVCSHPDPHQMNIICAHSTPDDLFICLLYTSIFRPIRSLSGYFYLDLHPDT